MAYSDFFFSDLIKQFGLTIEEQYDLFSAVPEHQPSELLQEVLAENLPLALAIQTEKARSELIIMPLLVELRRIMRRQVSVFSGVDFTVDPSRKLNGVCDYIVSLSSEQFFIRAPIVLIVEAKNENIKAGIAQCGAAMIAAQIFNAREETGITTLYGVVTTGSNWRFLRLTNNTLFIDQPEYYIERVEKILGILVHLVRDNQTHLSQAA